MLNLLKNLELSLIEEEAEEVSEKDDLEKKDQEIRMKWVMNTLQITIIR